MNDDSSSQSFGLKCPACGGTIAADTLQGLCPKCLMREALAAEESGSATDPVGAVPLGGFGNYDLLEELGHGGMGVVYKARQRSLDRVVALKMLLGGQFAGKVALGRFRAEAELAAQLQHPNIVAIHEISEQDGLPYFTMDFVAGSSLVDLVRDHPLSAQAAASYVQIIARAIHYAHEQGVLHRDLKPSNVLIDAFDQPRITDFGLAKRLTGSTTDLTVSGQALGTPNFMPPEQAAGKQRTGSPTSGPTSDIYGLGAILYYLLTARPPFMAETSEATLAQVLNTEPVAPRQLNPGLPQDLETICLKCLEKDPVRRYSSAGELADELERFRKLEPILAQPITRRRRIVRWAERNPVAAILWGIIACLGLAILLGTPWALWRINAERNRAVQRANEAMEQRGRAEVNLRGQQVARIEMLFHADQAVDAMALLGQVYAQNPADSQLAAWMANELTHRNFALPTVGPLVHDDRVCLVRFSPDGRRLLTANRENSAQIWDVSSGGALGSPLRHDASLANAEAFLGGLHPICAEFSPDGHWVATASVDNTARIWDAETGRPQGAPLRHPDWVTFVRYSPDGKLLATGCKDGVARLWDAAKGQVIGEGFHHAKWINSIVFSPDGQRVLTASDDRTARVWEVATQRPIIPPLQHELSIRAAVFSPDGQLVATASSDRTARIWDAETGAPRTGLLRHEAQLNVIQFSPDGRWLATGGFDRLVRIWRVTTGELQCQPLRHTSTVRSLDFSPEGLRIVTASEDRTARVWEVRSGSPLTESLRHDDVVWSACFSPDGCSVATASSDRTAIVWDVRPGKAMALELETLANTVRAHWVVDDESMLTVSKWVFLYDTRSGHMISPRGLADKEEVSAVALANGKRVFMATQKGRAGIWDAEAARFISPLILLGEPVPEVALAPDEKLAATASRDGQVRIWETLTAREVRAPLTHPGAVTRMEFSPDGRMLAVACDDLGVRLWLIPEGTPVTSPLVHEEWLHDLVFSPDGHSLAAACQDGTVRVWDIRTGRLRYPPLRHRGAVLDVDFTHDGRYLATASRDGTARVWIAETGQPRADPMTLGPPVRDAAFSPDGRWLALAGEDGRVGVWDTAASHPLLSNLRHSTKVNACEFSPTGLRLVTATSGHCAYIWDLVDSAGPPPRWLLELVEAIAGGSGAPGEGTGRASQQSTQVLRSRLLSLPANDNWGRWARWFLADRAAREISPLTTNRVENLLWRRLFEGDLPNPQILEDLIESLWIRPQDGDLNAQVATVLASPALVEEPDRLATAHWLSQRSLQLGATPFRGLWARASCLDLAGDQTGAVTAVEQAITAGSENAYFWLWSARLLEKAGQLEHGASALWKAYEVSEGSLAESHRQQIRQMHADYLKRHGLSP